MNLFKKIVVKYPLVPCFEDKTGNGYVHVGIGCLSKRIFISNWYQDGIFVLGDRGNMIYTFGSYGKKVGKFEDPLGICIVGDRDIWIADSGNNRIQVFNLEYKPIKSIRTGVHKPKLICATKSGQVIVSTFGSEILHVDQDGHIIRTWSYTQDQGTFPDGISCNSKGQVLVSVCHGHKILIFNEDGKLLHGFGSRGDGPGELKCPSAVCVDCRDNIFVADNGNHKISIFTPEGIPIQQIPFPGANNLCLMERQLAVVDDFVRVGILSN